MASYMYSPSQKVTDILSKFFDFDPSELQVGIWSGDLQVKNIKLRQEAIHPLLNRIANKPHVDPLKKAPLHMKLVSGTVGHLRMQIPWKRLVWGQGDVHVEISDVKIVITLQSREETEEQRRQGLHKERKKKVKLQEANRVSLAYREAKQRRLRDAERRHLQGMPLALYLETLHRKNSVARDAAKLEEAAKLDGKLVESSTKQKPGKLESWLQKVGSDFFWRFFSGIQGSISRAKIVIVQDGVELGCIIQSIEVTAGIDGTQVNVNMDDDHSDLTEEVGTVTETPLPQVGVVYESEYDDGEHVDKTIKQQGLGVFIRKQATKSKTPEPLAFSTSVAPDDYILRPVNLDLSFSFFYPFPPERRKKRVFDSRSIATPTTTASTSAAISVAESVAESTTVRRGKRDKDQTTTTRKAVADDTQGMGKVTRIPSKSALQKNRDSVMYPSALEGRLRNQDRRRLLAEDGSFLASQRSFRSTRSFAPTVRSAPSTARSGPSDRASAAPDPSADLFYREVDIVPKLECRVALSELRVIFTTRHYELLSYFFSTVARMKNGRPDQMIRWTPQETNTELFKRKFLDIPPEIDPPKEETDDEAIRLRSLLFRARNAKAVRAMLAPISGLVHAFDDADKDHASVSSDLDGQQSTPARRSIRSQAIHRWWKYAIGAIMWEVKKRKHLATNFRQMYISFDWKRQNYKRKEYVERYIAQRLSERKDIWPFEDSDRGEEELLTLEDELPMEQILLYRSIARAIGVRGMTTMPGSILDLRTTKISKFREKKKRRGSLTSGGADAVDAGDSNILSLVQRNFVSVSELREPGGLKKKLRSTEIPPVKLASIFDDIESEADEKEGPVDGSCSVDVLVHSKITRRRSRSFDSTSNVDSEQRRTPRQQPRRASLGNEMPSIQTGNFYASASIPRDGDVRTIRTLGKKDSKSTTGHIATEATHETKPDDRLRISCSLSIGTIEIMVVEEEYSFDLSPDQLKHVGLRKDGSVAYSLQDSYSDGDGSSSDQVSDISVMTEEERFFGQTGHLDRTIEEEEEDVSERICLSNLWECDLPEKPLLRFTMRSLGCSVRGRSGGRLDFGVSVRSMAASCEKESRIFSMGAEDETPSVSGVEPRQALLVRQKSFDTVDEDLDMQSVHGTRGRRSTRAIFFALRKEDSNKDLSCDISHVSLSLDLVPVSKLLQFYSKSEIKFPDKVIVKSSRDVARKFMVYKTASSQRFAGNLSSSVRIQKIEIYVPFSSGEDDALQHDSYAEASQKSDDDSLLLHNDIVLRSALLFSVDSFELHSGSYVEDIVAGAQGSGHNSSASQLSGSNATARALSAGRSLEMIDIIALTAANDAFSSKNIVATMTGINCLFETSSGARAKLIQTPVAMESLLTINEVALLDTESPKNKLVVEVSPLDVLLSKSRFEMISSVKTALDFGVLDITSSSAILKKIRKPDPPRIEILARKIMHSMDLNCKRVQLSLVRDLENELETITPKMKETILEECLGDFLSTVSCFELSFPNEEALSSGMQVCISRLMGLGLSNDDAWDCTNAARLNFLEDVAFIRRTHSEAMEELSIRMEKDALPPRSTYHGQKDAGQKESSEVNHVYDVDSAQISLSSGGTGEARGPSIDVSDPDDQSEDDDSTRSVEIVDTTLQNAIEKTVATFAPLLQGNRRDVEEIYLTTIVTLDLPLGFRLSTLKLFYDSYIAAVATSLVVTNTAGIELLTFVPVGDDGEDLSTESDTQANPCYGLSFSRYDIDRDYPFGHGGLPMSALAEDGDEEAFVKRARARLDDVTIAELELLFASNIVEAIIDEISKFRNEENTTKEPPPHKPDSIPKEPYDSLVVTASSLSALFTTDELVPFSRMTLEGMAYRNAKALERSISGELPSWLVVANNVSLHNLSPAGQFYPNTLSLITSADGEEADDFPFQIHFFASPDPWKLSSRLTIDFEGFRLFLLRQFIHELLQFFVYDRDGIGRLRKKYSKDIRDKIGNQRPPTLWSVGVRNTSVICPRSSTDSDMSAFEVGEAQIAVSYIPMSFEMPTESSPFRSNPECESPTSRRFSDIGTPNSFYSTTSEWHECMEDPEVDFNGYTTEPISSFSSDLKRRVAINLNGVKVYTVVAADSKTRDAVESPLFRFFYAIDGNAADGKLVYRQEKNHEHYSHVGYDALKELDRIGQRWEEISKEDLDVEIFADYAPHMRLFIGSRRKALKLDARMSQLCLLLSVWDNNMQEQPTMFPYPRQQVSESSSPPKIPDDFPEYGTKEFVAMLQDTTSTRSEICCIFKQLSLRCTYDPPGHFSVDPGCFKYMENPACPDEVKPGIVLALEDATVHVLNDFLNVRRIAIGALFLEISDERRHEVFRRVLSTRGGVTNKSPSRSWADTSWGLLNDITTFGSLLPMPVIFTVFMTPGWSLINVGAQSLNGIMHDLSWIWVFLDYFKSYYTQVEFGNRGHQAQRWVHKVKNAIRKAKGVEAKKFEPLPGVNVDFRLWLCQPILTVPSEYRSPRAPSLRVESRTGLWYRYKSIKELSSQEISTTDLNLFFSNDFQTPGDFREADARDNANGSRPLVEGLSFGLRYDCNNTCNHKDVSLLIPFSGENIPDLTVAGLELEVQPLLLPPAVVCRPSKLLSRNMGMKVCEITFVIEVLPKTTDVMINFFKGPTDVNEDFVEPEEDKGPVTFSVTADISDLRLFAIDPVLGVQLPVAVVSIASLNLCATKFEGHSSCQELLPGESPPNDTQLALSSRIWADYFKLGMTRSWEPLMEPFEFLLMQETSRNRGSGISVDAYTPLHLNLSGAFLQMLGDTLESFTGVIQETFYDKGMSDRKIIRLPSINCPSRDRSGAQVEDSIHTREGMHLHVLHEIPKPLTENDRVAFSMRNLTGSKFRVHQQTDRSTQSALIRPAVVTYLNHGETMGLTFSATISIIKNLKIVEVPYPGLSDSPNDDEKNGSVTHAVDVQLPGFRWIQTIKVDMFGRRFESLMPRSDEILTKMSRDWRLRNALMLLTEVGFDGGGRLVTVQSLFAVTNSTAHSIKLVFDPDPRRRPGENAEEESRTEEHEDARTSIGSKAYLEQMTAECEEVQIIQPGETFHIPTLLLQRSLHMSGSHLGCLWLCPDTSEGMTFWDFFCTAKASSEGDDLEVGFSSRPIQIARLVQESSVIFQDGAGVDISSDDAKSGIQVSCPTRSRKGGGRAPFCYAIEVGRSPLINSNRGGSQVHLDETTLHEPRKSIKKKTMSEKRVAKKMKEHIHGPVAYSLSIHAPLVIVNLLPEGGRFELMHAVRKTVVWYADLKPGQQVPVHSVGLDAPLLLLVNLGFCRTPVGEGALVHHGTDTVIARKGGPSLKSIGMAALKGTKHLGKTLSAISDSPDRRAQGRLAKVKDRHLRTRQKRTSRNTHVKTGTGYHESLGLENGNFDTTSGKIHSVDSVVFSQDDIATETTVVDGIGQRLTLSLENVRGGGGERRVSLYCPFWIVNTTEHPLRYKQDKVKSFVAGTVHSRERDGSQPLDGSNPNYQEHQHSDGFTRKISKRDGLAVEEGDSCCLTGSTVFAGTPGALATTPGHCELPARDVTELIDRNLPLDRIAQLAFMFNFHEEGLSIGHNTLSVQLYDGTGGSSYMSEWSRGFSLDSVGYSQIVAMNTKETRAVELSVEVTVAPGFLSSYTKIVRFVPRYIVFNRLERPVRIWQDSSLFRPVAEDQTVAGLETSAMNSDKRMWRYQYEEKQVEGRINQYEALYGRPSTIECKSFATRASMPEGTTAHRSALYIKTVAPDELMPFLLPDTRAERQLRVDLGGVWNMSPSFASDVPGEHILKVSRAVDLRTLQHVSTRAAPKYNIVLPPPENSRIGEWDGELGVFFETEWGSDRRIIVKGTKRGQFAFNHTDIHVGDELLRIDGVSVTKMSFVEVMRTIKERLALIRFESEQSKNQKPENTGRRMLRRMSTKRRLSTTTMQKGVDAIDTQRVQLVLTFSTLEERLRKLRSKSGRIDISTLANQDSPPVAAEAVQGLTDEAHTFKVETKSVHNTMFIILRKPEVENPPFRIQNRSIDHTVFFRQRDCQGRPWSFLPPGESVSYAWEEPMRTKKLSVRLAAVTQNSSDVPEEDFVAAETSGDSGVDHGHEASPEHEKTSARMARVKQALAYQYVDDEERGVYGPATSVRLEEIGFRAFLQVPSKEHGRNSDRLSRFLTCEVDTDGGTRILIVSDDTGCDDDRKALNKHLETLKKQISYEEQRIAGLCSLQYLLSKEPLEDVEPDSEDKGERLQIIENDAKRFVEDFPDENIISSRHQVVVEVLEAVGLHSSEFIGTCNPYCEIFLKGRSRSRQHFLQKRRNVRKTYFIENTVNPRWTEQRFVFDVPEEAVRVTRGHHLQVKLRNFRLVGQHPILGQAAVYFGSIRDQLEMTGWYPLAGRRGRSEVESAHTSDVARGSIKLRVQWIYTRAAIIDYFLMLAQVRLVQLTRSHDGMTEQLSHAIDSDERRREGMESVNAAGRITKLAKLQKRTEKKRLPNARMVMKRIEGTSDHVTGRINSSLTLLKGTLNTSRDRYLQALYFQTAESKRRRHSESSIHDLSDDGNSSFEKADDPENAAMDTHIERPMGMNPNSLLLLSGLSPNAVPRASPRKTNRKNKQSLDEFFATSKSVYSRSPFLPGSARLRPEGGESPRRRNRHLSLDAEIIKPLSHRKLSLDLDHPGEAYNGSSGNQSCVSDLLSGGTAATEEATPKLSTHFLRRFGFTFHDHGVHFHRTHLPHHFRRSLLAHRLQGKGGFRLYRPKFAAMIAPNKVTVFKSAQAASALFMDPELRVTPSKNSFSIHFVSQRLYTQEKRSCVAYSQETIIERLKVPEVAPITTKLRSSARVETLHLSRLRFERAARRNLGTILNPGGRLTVRPVTVLNLPEGHIGMVVKLQFGSEMLVSETADARVTPRWASAPEAKVDVGVRKASAGTPPEDFDIESTKNDLNLTVEPQQTSGSIKLTVVAERGNNKAEIGVLEIPLGAVIAACLDSQFDKDVGSDDDRPCTYVRWFPLMSPKMASPAEGDMGTSSRPVECEQPKDSMFRQYFTPCIQLAFIWRPENGNRGKMEKEMNRGEASSPAPAWRTVVNPRQRARSPAIERYINADISRISCALIDSQTATELLSLTAMNLDVRYSVTKTKTRTGLTVEWIQLDHQDPRAREPVVLAPTPTDAMQPTLQFLALQDNLRTKENIASYEYIGVAVREMDLTVEESWMFELWDFFMGVKRRRTAKRRSQQGRKTADFLISTNNCFSQIAGDELEIQSLFSILEEGTKGGPGAKLYVEQLILGLVKVNLSYIKGKKQAYDLLDRGVAVLKTGQFSTVSADALPEPLQLRDQSEIFLKWSQRTHEEEHTAHGGYNLPSIIAAVFPSVSDASIRLQGKVIDHVFESSGEIASSIKTFYTSETLKQVYKIIGSLDFVGNPTIIFSSFVSGVRDLVTAPTNAFLKSPTNVNQVGIAVGMGTLSFLSHSASGIFGFATKMSASAGQAAAILSLDKEFRQWHRENVVSEATNLNRAWKQRGIQSLPEMLTRPLGDIVLGIAMGASGLVIAPYKGFKKGGVAGLARGIALGTAGVVAKPLVGVLDAFTHFSATAHDVARSVNVLERRYQPALKLRLPYTFGPMNILSPFDPVSARSVHLLRTFPVKRKLLKDLQLREEILVHAEVLRMEPGVDTFAIATTIRIVLIRLKKDDIGNLSPTMCWEVIHGDDAKVASRISDHGHNGVALTITRSVAVDKVEELKGSKFRKPTLVSEVLNTPTFSSALSIDSGFSDVASEHSRDEAAMTYGESLVSENVVDDDDKGGTDSDPNFDHGATKRGNEVVKWYTVLAEYQHRPHLTRIHNVVSSLIGGYDAIIRDRSIVQHGEREGVTSFGIFKFEKPVDDQRYIATSNAALITSLETLPWIHGYVFQQIVRFPKAKQRQAMLDVRRNWNFATDLDCSKREGGPAWLVDERARATFIASHGDDIDPNKVILDTSWENRRTDEFLEEDIIFPESDIQQKKSLPVKALRMDDASESAGGPAYPPASALPRTSAEDITENEGDMFFSVVFQESILNRMDTLSVTSDDTYFVSPTAKTVHLESTPAIEDLSPSDGVLMPIAESTEAVVKVDVNVDASRMDRMESLMEKLVAINADQVMLKPRALFENPDENSTAADSRLTDMLKQEVAELRSQVQARAVEDDALRTEISLLRQQLADRREQINLTKKERSNRIKIPEMLRFGLKKGEKSKEHHQAGDGGMYRVYQTPLKDAPEESNRKMLKAVAGLSEESSLDSPISSMGMRRTRPGRRLSNESRPLGGTPVQRSSLTGSNSDHRPRIRRMSA